jgi:hypothetical protein
VKTRIVRKVSKRPVDAKGRTVFITEPNWATPRRERRVCRVDSYYADLGPEGDPIMDMSGCLGEFMEDWRRQCCRAGCPACSEAMMP